MNISSLQKARYEYAPKLPGMLRNGIADICVCEGAETQSVADQEKIKALFPNTYGKKEITFQKGQNTSVSKKQVVEESAVVETMGETNNETPKITIESDVSAEIINLINDAETKLANFSDDGKILNEDYSRKNATAEYDKIQKIAKKYM